MANEQILIVDDEPQIVRLCTQVLSTEGYQVRGVTSGREAIASLESESFDLLVVDIKMPDVDGLTVLRRGRAADPNLTSVVMTGYATMDRAIEALNSGARGFILKPFGIEEFDLAIRDALEKRQHEQERLRLRAQLPILEISQTLMTAGDVGELSRQLLEIIARQTGAARGALMLSNEQGTEMYVAAGIGLPAEALDAGQIAVTKVIERALRAEEILVLDAEAWDGLDLPLPALAADPDAGGLVLVPLSTGKKCVGMLVLGHPVDSEVGLALAPSDLNLLSIMGRQIAAALENARMYATEQQRTIELARALEQQQELEHLKNQFIQNVSHELRTPLSMILGYADLLASGDLGPVDAAHQGPLDIIVQRSHVLRDLIENITTILDNEMREPVREPVSLAELVNSVLGDFQLLADQAGLNLDGEVSSHLPRVLGDAEHLRRVVDNLIGNALKFTPAGGTVAVRLQGDDGGIRLQVADSGIGIPDEHRERIFERFYQVDGSTRRTYGGCGLGLALVREIVEKHGGTVAVESYLDKGSTFTVWLPAATTAPA